MNIGEKLKEARLRTGLAQKDVQEITGINHKTLSNYECGVSRPDADKLSVLCRLYKISADEIINVPLSDQEARDLYRSYVKAPRHIQEIVETALGWRPGAVDHSREGKG